jgi:hypothetical protein
MEDSAMPLKIFYEGSEPYVSADTPEEAAKFVQMLRAKTAQVQFPILGKTRDEGEAMHTFWEGINSNARDFLSHLMNHPDGVRGDQFSEEIGAPVDKFGGVLGGASKIAKRTNLRFGQIVISEMKTKGTERYRWLVPGPLLLKYGRELSSGVHLKMPTRITMGA